MYPHVQIQTARAWHLAETRDGLEDALQVGRHAAQACPPKEREKSVSKGGTRLPRGKRPKMAFCTPLPAADTTSSCSAKVWGGGL